RARRVGDAADAPAGRVLDRGAAAERVLGRGPPAEAVVRRPRGRAVRAHVREAAAEDVEVEARRRRAVVQRGDAVGLVEGRLAAVADGVDRGGQVAVGVVLAQPRRAGRVRDAGDAAQLVVGEAPGRVAGAGDLGAVAEDVVAVRGDAAQRVDGRV